MTDTSKIGIIAAQFMELVENEEPHDEVVEGSVKLGEIVIIGEVSWEEKVDGEVIKQISVLSASTTENRIHQTGILRWGINLIEDIGTPMENGPDDGEL